MQVTLTILFVIVTMTKAQNLNTNHTESVVNVVSGDIENDIDGVLQCTEKACVRKCCPLKEVWDRDKGGCFSKENKFTFPVSTHSSDGWKPVEGFNVTEKFNVLIGFNNCSKELNEVILPLQITSVIISTDGKLYLEPPETGIYGPDKYCIETFVSIKKEKPNVELFAVLCFVQREEKFNYILTSSCMLTSCFFILLTVAVYAWLPELHNLHGMVLMAYLLCFFVGFLVLGIMQILMLRGAIIQKDCTPLAFVIYFFLLAAFFWLNVMCYDIWWTFSGKRAHGRNRSTKKRFIYYAIYAFGLPTVLTTIMAALEFAELPIKHALLPNLRTQGCFLNNESKLLYFYLPIVILCVANMTFFTLTAFKIWKIKKETNGALDNPDSSTNKHNKQRLILYIKLFIVMGINWILEVVSYFNPNADFFWHFSDAYNALVGLVIFIIFVCKKKTFDLIRERIKNIQRLNSNSREMKNATYQNIDRCQTNTQRNASLNTVKTFISAATDSRKNKANVEETRSLNNKIKIPTNLTCEDC